MYITDLLPLLKEPTLLTMFIRGILAFAASGLIGYERNTHGAPAGMRTHMLVCLGAMIAMSTGQYATLQYGNADITRIGAQVVSGIGFLGAGSIIITRQNKVAGLTTAAGLWASACIGLAIGIGFYEGAVVGTLAVYIIERMLRAWSKSVRYNKHDIYKDTQDNYSDSNDMSSGN